MGPCDRITTRRPKGVQLQNISHGERRRRLATRIYQGTVGERVHSTVQVSIRVTILFHQKEGWKTTTSTGLPTTQLSHHEKPVPPT